MPPANTAPLVPLAGSSLRSAFSARMYNPVANPATKKAFSNGDGIWVYPGTRGRPLASIRLENFRDGLEDAALLRRLAPGRRAALVGEALSARTGTVAAAAGGALGVNVTAGPAELEALRRRAAADISSAGRTREHR